MRACSIAALAALAILLGGAVAFAYFGLSEPGTPMSPQFFVAIILGSMLSLGLGITLMTLLFYSHRKGFDEPPPLRRPPR